MTNEKLHEIVQELHKKETALREHFDKLMADNCSFFKVDYAVDDKKGNPLFYVLDCRIEYDYEDQEDQYWSAGCLAGVSMDELRQLRDTIDYVTQPVDTSVVPYKEIVGYCRKNIEKLMAGKQDNDRFFMVECLDNPEDKYNYRFRVSECIVARGSKGAYGVSGFVVTGNCFSNLLGNRLNQLREEITDVLEGRYTKESQVLWAL